MNDLIRVPEIRVISETGEQLGIIATREALFRAQSTGLDLVEVAPTEKPPVCRIMDYGKWQYQQQKQKHQSKKRQASQELKELRLRPKTDQHDLQIKLNKAIGFLKDGHKVQFTMLFRGRERLHKDIGKEIFRDIAEGLEDIAKTERESRFEGRRMFMVLAPLTKKSQKDSKPKEQKTTEDTEEKKQKEESNAVEES